MPVCFAVVLLEVARAEGAMEVEMEMEMEVEVTVAEKVGVRVIDNLHIAPGHRNGTTIRTLRRELCYSCADSRASKGQAHHNGAHEHPHDRRDLHLQSRMRHICV